MNKKWKKAWRKFYYTKWKRFLNTWILRFPWYSKRLIFWIISKHECFYCEAPLVWRTYTVDHFVAKSKGGTNKISNLRVCCDRCNRLKSNKHPTPKLLRHLKTVRIKHPVS